MKISPDMNRSFAAASRTPSRLGAGIMIWIIIVGAATGLGAHAQALLPDTIAQRTIACTACHGQEGRATSDGYYPRIAGKPAGYLYNQLLNFREGRRTYASMTYMVDQLPDAYLLEIAQYFSSLHPPYAQPQASNASAAILERGRALALAGDRSRNLPACAACHGQTLTGVAPFIPGLVGLPKVYLSGQFGAWKNGVRRAAAPDCMAEIVKRMTIDEIDAVTAWLASRSVPDGAAPATSLVARLPIACGSVRQ